MGLSAMALLAVLAGCSGGMMGTDGGGGGTDTGGTQNACMPLTACMNSGGQTCTDSGFAQSIADMACTQSGGTIMPACPHANALGGCLTTTRSGCQVSWFYPPTTMAQAQSTCTASMGTFIAP
jgi:hypothetical protein